MVDSLVIRPATENDLQGILDVYNHAILTTTSVYQEEPHNLAMRKAWFEEKQKLGYPIFVAEVNNNFAGFSTYGPFRNWPGYRFTVEHSVYVNTSYRRMGIGKKLVEAVVDYAKLRNMHALIAGIDSSGVASIRLHQSLGFKEVAYFKEVGFKFNRWLDLIFMELLLN